MFEIITTIVDIMIALIGLFFVIIEARKSRKRNQKERIEEANCLELANQAGEIKQVISKIKEIQTALSASLEYPDAEKEYTSIMTDRLKTVIRVMHEDCKEVYFECEKAENKVREVYENLLKNESMFSLSLGFERIINVCRELVYELCPIREKMNWTYTRFQQETKKIGFYQCGNYTADDLAELEKLAKQMNETLSETYAILDNAYRYIRELEIKFSV